MPLQRRTARQLWVNAVLTIPSYVFGKYKVLKGAPTFFHQYEWKSYTIVVSFIDLQKYKEIE